MDFYFFLADTTHCGLLLFSLHSHVSHSHKPSEFVNTSHESFEFPSSLRPIFDSTDLEDVAR